MIIRYNAPNKFSNEPYGTICKVVEEEGERMYVQVGTLEAPCWLRMEEFLYKVYRKEMMNENFIEDCLKKYLES